MEYLASKKSYFLYFLSAVFASFASYRLHLEGFEGVVAQGLEDIILFHGRAPDQYRIIPYLILGSVKTGFELLTQSNWGWKFPIIFFETTSLFLPSLALDKLLGKSPNKTSLLMFFFLLYPYLMFDGVRAIAAFILMISAYLMYLSTLPYSVTRNVVFFVLLLIFSFTRADIALLVGLISSINMSMKLPVQGIILALPLGSQFLLNTVIFPNAKYYSELVMIEDNLSLGYFIGNPLSYFLLGIAIRFWKEIKSFLLYSYSYQKVELVLLAGYVLVVFIIGRPNEYRLFLPFLPIVISMVRIKELRCNINSLTNES